MTGDAAPQATGGQAAYEGMVRHAISDGGPPGRAEGWDNLQPWQHGRWEASAAAVAAPLNAENASLRGQLATMTAARDDLARNLDAEVRAAAEQRTLLANHKRAAARVHEELAAKLDRLRIGDTDLRHRLDDLASQWEHGGCTCDGDRARELREALEGGTHG